MGTHPIFESDFDCLTDMELVEKPAAILEGDHHTDSDQSDSETEQTETIFDIARILASNTLKERNVGYKKMENLLFGESEFNLDNDAALKVWKGLFFMLWHSDGYARQEKLANRIADTCSRFSNIKNKMNFFQGCILILSREWMGIDRLRMDKYMMTLRLMFRSVLKSLADGGWNHAHIDWFIGVLGCAPLQHMQPTGKDSSSPLGVRFHFADLWIEELLKVGGSKTETPLDSVASAKFINCWVKVATMTNIGQFRKRIREKIFEELIERSDVSIKVMEDNDPESPVLAEMKEEGFINVDYEKLVEYILEFSNGEEVKSKQRKAMYRIAKRFKSLAEGELPLDDISEWKVNENDPVDHFLFQSENSFGRKDLIKMKGLKRKPSKYALQ